MQEIFINFLFTDYPAFHPVKIEVTSKPEIRYPFPGENIRRSVMDVTVKRGEIYYADLSPVVGSEQGGVRPVLIVQNDVGNKYSPTVIAAAITSQKEKSKLPTHIELDSEHCGLSRDSVVLLEQIRTIDKKRLKEKMGSLDTSSMYEVNKALSISFGLGAGGSHFGMNT